MPTPARSESPEESCTEKERLECGYSSASRDYSRALAVLQRYAEVMFGDQYQHLRTFVEEARLRCEHARTELEHHITEHGC
jgi:hypothetical protein